MNEESDLRRIAICLIASGNVLAQGIISTVAGGTGFLDNIPATQARIAGPTALAVDSQGNAYIGDGSRIRKINAATGLISTVTSDTGANQLALGAGGTLLLVGNKLLKLDPVSGVLTTVSATGGAGLATDSTGNIYLTDGDTRIYRIDPTTGAITLIAGTGLPGDPTKPVNGVPATQAYVGRPYAITVDPFGNIFFAEQYWLCRIDGKTGMITTIAPNLDFTISGDGGPYSKAVFRDISALATDRNGNLYIADSQYIREIVWSTGIVSTIAGSGQQQYSQDGVPALKANLSTISTLVVDAAGDIWIADAGNARVFEIAVSTGLIHTIAGTSANGDGGPALGAVINPIGLAADSQGDLFFWDQGIRRVDCASGTITTLFPEIAFPTNPLFGNSRSIALDASGNLYVSKETVVERVDSRSGTVTVVAGDGFGQYGEGGSLGDGGPATKAQVTPLGVAVDSSGNIYIADEWYSRIRRVDANTGVIQTIAGDGQQTFSGAPGPPLQTAIGVPLSIAIAPSGDVYWSTVGWVLKINAAGSLSIVAGNGGCGYSGDGGSALLANLCSPLAIAFDHAGNLFVSEGFCGCVRRVDAETGLIQTVAGTGSAGVSNDGILATQASLNPGSIVYSNGALFIGDGQIGSTDIRIRAVTPPAPPTLPQPPSITSFGDAVDYQSAFSPGAIVSIFGNYLGGQSPSSGQVGTNGRIPSNLAGVEVTFNGIPSPLLFVSAGQINTVVPFTISLGSPKGQVTTGAGIAALPQFGISSTSLTFFPGLVFNSDGTLNSAANPAPKGATLLMYGTGMGQTNPPLVDGSIVLNPPFPQPLAKFSAMVLSGTSSYSAAIAYLGPLPGFVAGAVQANIQVPPTVPAGKWDLAVYGPTSASFQTIYLLSDPPVLTGISPSPVPHAAGNYVAFTGQNLEDITSFNFLLNGKSVSVMQQQYQPCTSTSCTVFVNFAGVAGQYSLIVTNAANQVSNQFTFTVLP